MSLSSVGRRILRGSSERLITHKRGYMTDAAIVNIISCRSSCGPRPNRRLEDGFALNRLASRVTKLVEELSDISDLIALRSTSNVVS
ncbi:hypothetical protein HKBW3S47_01161 [Candidatus Hakubella thermalkaliphila]|uniref:Uncharacterized protein n=1 Tax=Candidatus Hakubella thermalkaliphila TaxID=2754717 RepID=A0A6V8Q4N5_9ACTN|nr:hypothetical protein HKBW3S47_01161 [Candidatus Hakubella thermalkaliphila]